MADETSRRTSARSSRRSEPGIFGFVSYCWENADIKSPGGWFCIITLIVVSYTALSAAKGFQGRNCGDTGFNPAVPADYVRPVGCFLNGVLNRVPDSVGTEDVFQWGEPTDSSEESSSPNLIAPPAARDDDGSASD